MVTKIEISSSASFQIGSMRPERAEDLDGCARLFEQSLRSVSGTLYVNVKRLVRLNNIAFRVLADMMVSAVGSRPDLRISVITSSVVGWYESIVVPSQSSPVEEASQAAAPPAARARNVAVSATWRELKRRFIAAE